MTTQPCPAYNERVAITLPHGTVVIGRNHGCVFGDCSSAHEHYVLTEKFYWPDGTIVRGDAAVAGKFWGVRPLTDAEQAREQREYDLAMSHID